MSDPTPDAKLESTPCPEREEALALQAGRDLPEAEARELERHLASCEGCRTLLAEMEDSLRVFAGLTVAPPAQDLSKVHRGVMEQVQRESARTAVLWGRSSVRWAAAAALFLILGAALLWRLGSDREENRREPGDPVIAARTEKPPEERVPTLPSAPVPKAPETAERPDAADPSEEPQPNVAPEPVPRPRPVPQSDPEPETQRASLEDGRPDLKIQLISEDPAVVIYWLVEPENPQDATSTS